MLPHDARIRFERALNLVGWFAALTGWQHAHDLKRWRAPSSPELELEEFWAMEMKKDVVAGPVSRHERSPAPGLLFLFWVTRLLCRRAREIQPPALMP
jgi:hypothetical protein